MTENPYESPAAFSDLETGAADADRQRYVEKQQLYVNRLLNRGVVFSLIWLMGFGSIYSVFLAAKARRIIRQSDGELRGVARMWWCFIMGGFGILLFGTVLIAILVNG